MLSIIKRNTFIMISLLLFIQPLKSEKTVDVKVITSVKKLKSYYVTENEIVYGTPLKLSGVIRLIGSASFAELVLTNGSGLTFYLECDEELYTILYSYQYMYARLSGSVSKRVLKTADGKHSTKKLYLNVESVTILREKVKTE